MRQNENEYKVLQVIFVFFFSIRFQFVCKFYFHRKKIAFFTLSLKIDFQYFSHYHRQFSLLQFDALLLPSSSLNGLFCVPIFCGVYRRPFCHFLIFCRSDVHHLFCHDSLKICKQETHFDEMLTEKKNLEQTNEN